MKNWFRPKAANPWQNPRLSRGLQFVLLIVAILYPLFGYFHKVTRPLDFEDLAGRLAVSVVFLISLTLAKTIEYFRSRALLLVHLCMYTLTSHLFYLVAHNSLSAEMVWSITISLLMVTYCLYTLWSRVFFVFLVAAGSSLAALGNSGGDVHPSWFILFTTSIAFYSAVEAYIRSKYISALKMEIKLREVAELKTKESERFLSSILDNSPACIAIRDLSGRLLMLNRAFEEKFKVTWKSGSSHSVLNLPSFSSQAQHVLATRSVMQNEEVLLLDGKNRTFFAVHFPLLDTAGEIFATGSILSDVTESKEAELAAREHEARMVTASKFSALGEMAAGIAHEINNPLMIINGYAHLLANHLTQSPPNLKSAKDATRTIQSTVERVSRIVYGLRNYAREGSKDPRVPTSIQEVISNSLALCQERYRSNDVKVDVSDLNSGWVADIRGVQISQVLINLLNNSFDAVAERNEKWVRIEVSEGNDNFEIAVLDSGEGVPQGLDEKIMLPFYTTKPVGKGTGLGLSISKGIVEAHGGHLKLDRSNTHTRFVFNLPKHADGAAGRA